MVNYPLGQIKRQKAKNIKPKIRKNGPEKVIQNNIIACLRMNRCSVMRLNVGLLYTKDGRPMRTGLPNGTPDLCGYRWKDGKMFFIEVKTPKGRIRPAQMEYHKDLMHHRIIHGIARSVDDALLIVKKGLIGFGYPDTESKDWY